MDSNHRNKNNHASFSSTLLDAIYRSIDDDGGEPTNPKTNNKPLPPPPISLPTVEHWKRTNPNTITKHHRRSATPTSSSSDTSSCYGGFSSSEPESVRSRPIGTRAAGSSSFPSRSRRPEAAAAVPPPPPAGEEKRGKKDRNGSIRNRLMRDLWRGRSAGGSPGFRFASFFNSLFSSKSECLSKTKGKRGNCVEKKEEVVRRRMEEKEKERGDESDSSSDLFELENMGVVVVAAAVAATGGRFRDELPVYETTNPRSYSGNSRFYS